MKNLTITALFMLMAVFTLAQTATPPAAGDGTSDDPYQIATLDNLYWLSQNSSEWDKHYIQTANFSANATSTWDLGDHDNNPGTPDIHMGFSPIGDENTPFSGSYNGQRFVISRLFINRYLLKYTGLFGVVASSPGPALWNIKMSSPNIQGGYGVGYDSFVGCIAGAISGSDITHSSVSDAHVEGVNVGAIVGFVSGGANLWICSSYQNHVITQTLYGLGCGLIASTIANNSYLIWCAAIYGQISSPTVRVGGIVSSVADPGSEVWACYVKECEFENGGGIAYTNNGVIEYCYYIPMGSKSTKSVCGTICDGDGSATGLYYNSDLLPGITDPYATGKTSAELKLESTYVGWDFIDTWAIDPDINDGYPYLQDNPPPDPPVVSINSVTASPGTANVEINISSFGGSTPSAYGVCYNTTGNPNTGDTKVEHGTPTSTGNYTISLTGLSASTEYFIKAYAINDDGPGYSAEQSFTTGTSIIWDGSESTAWNTAGNWDLNQMPTTIDDATIPTSGNNPEIASGIGANCVNLTVEADATLTIKDGGSLITNGTIINSGTINIEKNIGDGEWHLISIPTTGITANTFLGDYLQEWDETMHVWTDISEPETELYPKQGYGLWATPGKATSYTFTGTPLTSQQTQAITFTEYSAEPEAYEGSNLLGNPYPSYIDWDLVTGYGAKYTWNGTSYDAYTAVSGFGTGSRYLSPMEGFFIVTNSAGTFQLSNSQRTNDNSVKSAKGFEKGIVLAANSGELENSLQIVFDETASENFELAKDAWKFLSGTPGLSEIYSIGADGNYTVDVRPECETIQLGFTNDEAGAYSIEINEIADIPEAYLEDTKTGTFHNLINGRYEFAWDTSDDEKRFKLHFNSVGIEESTISESNIRIYADGQQIFIKGAESGEVMVSDVMGRIVLQQNISASELCTIPVNLQTGIYIVSVKSGNEVKTEKVFIK